MSTWTPEGRWRHIRASLKIALRIPALPRRFSWRLFGSRLVTISRGELASPSIVSTAINRRHVHRSTAKEACICPSSRHPKRYRPRVRIIVAVNYDLNPKTDTKPPMIVARLESLSSRTLRSKEDWRLLQNRFKLSGNLYTNWTLKCLWSSHKQSVT